MEKKKNLSVSVLFVGESSASSKFQQYEAIVEVSVEALPEDLIEIALHKMSQYSKINFTIPSHECVLKVIGREEYLVDRKPISQYKVHTHARTHAGTHAHTHVMPANTHICAYCIKFPIYLLLCI